MSIFHEVVIGIAKCMEKDADHLEKQIKGLDKPGVVFLRAYASDLRSAARRASQGFTPQEVEVKQGPVTSQEGLELERITRKQEAGPWFVEMDGGAFHGSSVACDPKMPEGARVPFNGAVYVFKEGKLCYSPEESAKLKRPA